MRCNGVLIGGDNTARSRRCQRLRHAGQVAVAQAIKGVNARRGALGNKRIRLAGSGGLDTRGWFAKLRESDYRPAALHEVHSLPGGAGFPFWRVVGTERAIGSVFMKVRPRARWRSKGDSGKDKGVGGELQGIVPVGLRGTSSRRGRWIA